MTRDKDPNGTQNGPDDAESPFPGPAALCGPNPPHRPCLDAGCRQRQCIEHQAAVELWPPQDHVEAHQWVTAMAEAIPGIVFQAIGDDYMITAECPRSRP